MITPEQSARLKDYFPVEAHEFLQGKTYIREDDITDRLDEVDPSWTFERLDITVRDTQVIATFRLTVCGVFRDGVGMDSIKSGGAGEAEKSAATDALKRASRLFGIGRYILDMKGVNDAKSAATWLAARRHINTSTGEMPQANVTPLNSRQEAVSSDLPKAVGDYEIRTPQQALNGNGAKPGQKKESDTREWTASAVTVRKDKFDKPYLQYTCAEGKPTGRGRDLLRQAGYECESWTAAGETYDLIPPALVTVEKNGNFWNVLSLKAAVVSTEAF